MMQPGPYIQKKKTAPDTLRQSTLRLGFFTMQFGVLNEQPADNAKSKTLICRIYGREPKHAGGRVNVFSIGLKMISFGGKVKIGFIKRKQILERA